MKTKCPNCGKGLTFLPNMVKSGDLKCKYCGTAVNVENAAPGPDPAPKPPSRPSGKPPDKPAPSPKPTPPPRPVAEEEYETEYLI